MGNPGTVLNAPGMARAFAVKQHLRGRRRSQRAKRPAQLDQIEELVP